MGGGAQVDRIVLMLAQTQSHAYFFVAQRWVVRRKSLGEVALVVSRPASNRAFQEPIDDALFAATAQLTKRPHAPTPPRSSNLPNLILTLGLICDSVVAVSASRKEHGCRCQEDRLSVNHTERHSEILPGQQLPTWFFERLNVYHYE